MSFSGTVKSFNDLKGWGFVVYEGRDVFLHIRECKDGRPSEGDLLMFDMEEDPVRQGQMRATNVVGCTRSMDDIKGGGKGKGNGGQGKGTGAFQGPVKSFNDMKGWGFVTLEGKDIFLHIRDCNDGRPVPGDWVTFDMTEDAARGTGQMKAVNVSGCSGYVDNGKGWGKTGGKGGYGPAWDKGWGGGKDAWGAGPCGKGGAGSWGGDSGGCKGGKGGFAGGGMKGGCGFNGGMKGAWGAGCW